MFRRFFSDVGSCFYLDFGLSFVRILGGVREPQTMTRSGMNGLEIGTKKVSTDPSLERFSLTSMGDW